MTIKRGVGLMIPTMLLGGVLLWRLVDAGRHGRRSGTGAVRAGDRRGREGPGRARISEWSRHRAAAERGADQGAGERHPDRPAGPEGHEVHKGDVVAEIDPRPYKAALDQAMAQRDEDAALLQSATAGPAAIRGSRQEQLRAGAAGGRPAGDGEQGHRRRRARQRDDRDRADQSGLLRHPRADRRAGELLPDQCRQPHRGRQSDRRIISITQDKPISVVFTLPEADLLRVQEARAKGPRAGRRRPTARTTSKALATGTLLTPNNTIDTTTGTISLKATFDNSDDHLWPGQFVNTRVQVDVLQKARYRSPAGGAARSGRAVRLRCQTGPDGRPGRISRSVTRTAAERW